MLQTIKFLRHFSSINTKLNTLKLLENVTQDRFTAKFMRSSGPGGQNVNKLNTKVELRLNLSNADWIPSQVLSKLIVQEKNCINKHGELVVTSDKYRLQHRNIEDAMQKVKVMLSIAAFVPEEPSVEALQRVQERKVRAKERRLVDKRYKSIKKSDRKSID